MLEFISSNICELKSLEHLNLSGCSKLDGFPVDLGNLGALKVFKAQKLSRCEVPSSIVNLVSLVELNLTSCCIKELPINLGQLSSLESLILGRNNFESIPPSIIDLSKLSYLDLSYCERLQSLPQLPQSLRSLDAQRCTSLEAASHLSILFSRDVSQSARVNFLNCFKLVDQNEFQEIVKKALQKIDIMRGSFFPRRSACTCFPGNEIPEWFNLRSAGSSITLELIAPDSSRDLSSLIMCAIVEFKSYHHSTGEGLVVGFDCSLTTGDHGNEGDKTIGGLCHGTLTGLDRRARPDYVDFDQIFLGYDFPLKFSDSVLYNIKRRKNCKMIIKFYVENLSSESIDCCKVTKCGVWSPDLQLMNRSSEEESNMAKRMKFSVEDE